MACAQSLYRTTPGQRETQDYVNQVMVPFTGSHIFLILIGGTLMAALIGGYIAQNWLKKNKWSSAFLTESTRQTCFSYVIMRKNTVFFHFVRKDPKGDLMMKNKNRCLGALVHGGTALAQVLNDNGHEVRIWGNIPEQIDEINEKHTNTRYFKDVVLDENIKAYKEPSEALDSVDAVLFVVPTKVTRLVAKQVAELLDHKVVVMHASKGLEPGTHERLSTILEEEIPEELRSDIVVVSGPSHAEETIVRDITLITAASKDLEVARYVQGIFSNNYFRLYTNSDVIGVETAGAL